MNILAKVFAHVFFALERPILLHDYSCNSWKLTELVRFIILLYILFAICI